MNVVRMCASVVGIAVYLACPALPGRAQAQTTQQHVVGPEELNKQAARPTESRQANENAIRHLLSSDEGQKTLKSANVDYKRIDNAIGQLSDEEVSKLAERSRQAESDFAAGFISAKTLAYIIIAIVIIVVIVVLV